jgi:methylmalonyl-CoA/ethylmalonyl-CoA epimerase
MTDDLRLDHIAIAVRSVDAAADKLAGLLGYHRATEKVMNTRQRVNVVFLEKTGSLPIKLIEPSDSESPLCDFVKKGGGLHHICFKASGVEAACADLSARGARVIASPQPGEAFDERLIAFLYLGLGLNVEIIDTDQRRARIEPAADHATPREH